MNKSRYFFISFYVTAKQGDGFGSMTVEMADGSYPNMDYITAQSKEGNKEVTGVTIINITELGRLDYADYTRKLELTKEDEADLHDKCL